MIIRIMIVMVMAVRVMVMMMMTMEEDDSDDEGGDEDEDEDAEDEEDERMTITTMTNMLVSSKCPLTGTRCTGPWRSATGTVWTGPTLGSGQWCQAESLLGGR